jgi:hypothetical protein
MGLLRVYELIRMVDNWQKKRFPKHFQPGLYYESYAIASLRSTPFQNKKLALCKRTKLWDWFIQQQNL